MTTYVHKETGEVHNEWDMRELFDDMLDEVYGEVSIGGYMYYTSNALKCTDPHAYREGFLEFLGEYEEVE